MFTHVPRPRLRATAARTLLLTLLFGTVAPIARSQADPAPRDVGSPPGSFAPPTHAAPAPEARAPDVDAYTIPPPPDWSDRYGKYDPASDVRYFRIGKLMADFGLSRLAAVEVQSHYRQLTTGTMAPAQAFAVALSRVQAGQYRSGIDPAKLRAAPFIVVYDLDETLYQMSYRSAARGPAFRDYAFDYRGQPGYVKLRPGWQAAIDRIHALGGLVILFTARADDTAESAIAAWHVGDRPIRDCVDGVLSKSHMILQEKTDGDPIIVPSKDLRLFDESLGRVIIVDDNPKRIVQHHRQRLVKKFQADPYLAAAPASVLARSFEQTLPAVLAEIEESRAYQAAHAGSHFADVYLPYTLLGRVAMEALQTAGLTAAQARDFIRRDPTYVDDGF